MANTTIGLEVQQQAPPRSCSRLVILEAVERGGFLKTNKNKKRKNARKKEYHKLQNTNSDGLHQKN